MPEINGRYYANPAYGRALERARTAEKESQDSRYDTNGRWVTIDHHHVLIRDTDPQNPRPRANQPAIHFPSNEKERRLAVAGPGSGANLHDARVAVGEVSERAIEEGHAHRVAPDEIQGGLWKGLNDKNPAAIDSWNDSLSAARAALAGADSTNRAMQFRLDAKNGSIPRWARGREPSETFGPFRNAGGGDAATPTARIYVYK